MGRVHFAHGIWAGVQVMALRTKQGEFDAPIAGSDVLNASRSIASAADKQKEALNNARLVGKHDGKIEGIRYFRCPDRTGLFVRPSKLRVVPSAT